MHAAPGDETCNPWTVVDVVFSHLAERGLHPALGRHGDPSVPAAALLAALGIAPANVGERGVTGLVGEELAELRATLLDDPG